MSESEYDWAALWAASDQQQVPVITAVAVITPAERRRRRDRETPPQRDTAGRLNDWGGSRGRLQAHEQLALKRELALGADTQTALGEKYGMSQQGIANFLSRHRAAIDAIRSDAADELAGIPLARKINRLEAYAQEVERLSADVDPKFAGDHARGRQNAIRSIAEELGELPDRNTVQVAVVTHVVQGFSDGELAEGLT